MLLFSLYKGGWSETGFLSAFRDGNKFISDTGLIDFAGSGIVHTVGLCTLIPILKQ